MISNPEFYIQPNQKDDSARHTSILKRLLRGVSPKMRSGRRRRKPWVQEQEGGMGRARVTVGAVH